MSSTETLTRPKLVTDSLGLEYCLVRKATFQMGEHNVEARIPAAFYMARHTVTRELFMRFCAEADYRYEAIHLKRMDHISPYPDCPATPLSWWDAKYFIRWIRHVTGEYYSLPREVEWEAAARGTDGRLFPWGNAMPTDEHACYSSGFKRTTADRVGRHPLGNSPAGCADMVGNIWEYCLDDLDEDGEIHVLRGGSCRNKVDAITCISRAFASPSTLRVNYSGFRMMYLPGDMYGRYVTAMERESRPVMLRTGGSGRFQIPPSAAVADDSAAAMTPPE